MCRRHYDMVRLTGSAVRVERERLCPVCGRWFVLGRRDRIYDSDRCRKRAERSKLPQSRGVKARLKSNRPVVRRGGKIHAVKPVVGLFTDADVWDFRKGVCAQCGGRVDLHGAPLSPDALASAWMLDLADGGSPELANRVLLHNRCVDGWERSRHGGKRKKGK
jgi:hypothetical protein